MSGGTSSTMPAVPVFSPTAGTYYGDPNAMFDLSRNMIIIAETYLGQLGSAAASLVPPVINPSFPTISGAPAPATNSKPDLQKVAWVAVTLPGDLPQAVPDASYLPKVFDEAAPKLVMTDMDFGFGETIARMPEAFSQVVPEYGGFSPPTAYPSTLAIKLETDPEGIPLSPNTVIPEVPSPLVLDKVVREKVVIPAFSATVPTLSAAVPGIKSYIEAPMYTSALLTQAQTDLQRALSDGTWTGLPAAAEGGLWDRGSEREFRAQADALADLDRMEALGYAFPPGIWLDARLKIQTETDNTRTALSREIMIKQAEMTLDNIIKARSEAVLLEGKLIDYANQMAQRTLEACKYVTEAGVQIYNAAVEGFKASLEGFKVKALVYETQIRGLEATIKSYQAEIDFEKTKADINTALVSQYTSEVNAAIATLKINELQLEMAKIQIESEKVKVEAFGAKVQAFNASVGVYSAKIGAFKSQGDVVSMFGNAFKMKQEGFAALADGGSKVINTGTAQYKNKIDAYAQQVEVYKTQIQDLVGQAQSANFYNTAQAEMYRAEIAGLQSYNEVLTKQWEAAISQGTNIAQVAVKAAEANGQLYISSRSLALDASKVGAQVTAQLGAASLNAIHWSSSVSQSASDSFSTSTSVSQSTSTSQSTSNVTEEIHNTAD